ncbi:MAG: transcriptional regulator AlsR family [Firmicutes bacterium]|nr:transcriptional regulator AlsR family [Bacillota bacterium]
MDTRLLRYFVAAAEHLNFSEAAKSLYITQPALGRQITQLEQQIGVSLFIRNTRKIKLTAAGTTLLNQSYEILAKTEFAVNMTRQAANTLIGNLQLGFMGPLEQNSLPQLVKIFHDKYPSSTIGFNMLGQGSLNEALETGNIDIAFTTAYDLDQLTNFAWKTSCLSKIPKTLGIIVHSRHPLARRKSISLYALARESFVIFSRTEFPLTYDHMYHKCLTAGFQPNISAQALDLESLLDMVKLGIGIAIHPKPPASKKFSGLHFIPLCDYNSNNASVVAWKTTNINPLIPLFLKTLQEEKFLVDFSPDKVSV